MRFGPPVIGLSRKDILWIAMPVVPALLATFGVFLLRTPKGNIEFSVFGMNSERFRVPTCALGTCVCHHALVLVQGGARFNYFAR